VSQAWNRLSTTAKDVHSAELTIEPIVKNNSNDLDSAEHGKLLMLKKLVFVVVSDMRLVLGCVKHVLELSTLPHEIILLVKVVQEIKQILLEVIVIDD